MHRHISQYLKCVFESPSATVTLIKYKNKHKNIISFGMGLSRRVTLFQATVLMFHSDRY